MSDFAHYIKVRFGCEPGEPTDEQMKAITADIETFVAKNKREPRTDEIGAIVGKRCPSAGRYKYAADVNVELRRQIAQLAAKIRQ